MAKSAPQSTVANLRDNIVRLFGGDDTPPPETKMDLLRPAATDRPISVQSAQPAIDLSGQHKLITTFGPGNSGKTTLLRWMIERCMESGRPVPNLATVDAARPALKLFFDDVIAPSSPATAEAWLEKLMFRLMGSPRTLLLDFGADASLLPLLQQIPTLEKALIEAEVAPVAFYLLTPREIDLTVLDGMERAGFRPAATCLVLNIGTMQGRDPEEEFAQLRRNSTYRAAIDRGAMEVWMPKNFAARTLEERRMPFYAGARKGSGIGLGDQYRAHHWIEEMNASFAPVETWLP